MTTHPAPFSQPIIEKLRELTKDWDGPLLDPYAGIGRIALLDRDDVWGTEIEPEFVEMSLLPPERRFCIDSRFVDELILKGDMPQPRGLVFSPDYGNRFADQYLGTPAERDLRERTGKAPRRRSYAISLNRRVTKGSGAAYQWGSDYRDLHSAVMESVTRALEPGARCACNVSDHYRGTEKQYVEAWWGLMLSSLGWKIDERVPVPTFRFRDGSNSELRADEEWIIISTLTNNQEEQ